MEKYLDIPNSNQKLKVSVSYTLGGHNHFTGGISSRGYYIHLQPVEISNGWEKATGFTGIKKLLVEVSRKSNKKYEEACGMVTDSLIEELKGHCKIEYIA